MFADFETILVPGNDPIKLQNNVENNAEVNAFIQEMIDKHNNSDECEQDINTSVNDKKKDQIG